MDELVALYDGAGRPVGAAPRSRMRADNLHHAATAVVVRDGLGRVYVHRRTDTKDVYPGLHDFAAGGVVAAGEAAYDAAVRELAEELGVSGVPLEPVGEGDYRDAHTSYHGFCYTATWDGPVSWQPEEVAWGEWLPLEELLAWVDREPEAFVPDSRALLLGWLRGRAAQRRRPEQGWDFVTEIVEERWVDRAPRRPEGDGQLRREVAVLPRIADRLPLAVPRPVVLTETPLRVRHVLVPGSPAARLGAEDGAAVGRFLRALHATPRGELDALPPPGEVYADLLRLLGDLRDRVLPLLPADRRAAGAALLDEVARRPAAPVLIHGDLGPAHLLSDGGRVSGVIDWGDLRLGDPGLDLAWTLHGTPEEFAEALATAYDVGPELRRRSLAWRRLGPWWEVTAGLDFLGEEYVVSGLEGVLARLPG